MDYVVSDSNLTSVADAIRTKAGTSAEIYFPDGFVSAIGAIPMSYTLLASTEIETSTTSTSSTQCGLITDISGLWTKDKIVYIRVRDKAGKRPGYFYGTDTFLFNSNAANGESGNISTGLRITYRYNSDSSWGVYYTSGSAAYGVYGYSIYDDGKIYFFKRYHADNSLTVNGTYVCEVFLLDWPGGVSPFNAPSPA